MVNRWAVAAGNWSAPATWNGGTLPDPADDVYANNKLLVIDQSIAVQTLRTSSGTGITAGGQFNVTSSSPVTIDIAQPILDTYPVGSGALIVPSGAGAVTINCPYMDSPTSGGVSNRLIVVQAAQTGLLTINTIINTNVGIGIELTNAGFTVVNGNIRGGSSTGAFGLYMSAGTPKVTVNGDVIGGSASVGVHNGAGLVRFSGDLQWGSTGIPPYSSTVRPPMIVRDGGATVTVFSDDAWPTGSGAAIVLGQLEDCAEVPTFPTEGIIWPPSALTPA